VSISQQEVEQFLYREARYLDDREFDKWLECYHPEAEFWMPAWDDDAKALGVNPVLSGVRVEDEGLYPVQHGYWLRAMRHAVDLEAKEGASR
jgi:3-phenylpropionate/cinnamic acid dioxygenase small subunit